ncbi:sulfotransferase family protein [Gloeocapsopsis dulcis]|uniref:Sulfotransferase domain-containing protein n=1 Tax=Gloeocapsopsis dulcis AAB1 = 1H9 TaxID=1433147 RepID=A0A6N8FV10_9CHRO|nr:sulfotransferase [Gloeocapsopsis dulcis]MUL35987.1 hypothetical protein [Gloeocapsopsis dulcis AAB1 = 1H9]WNN88241.1 sulfotransferase [Gloeocapsopsis dulcis]
MNYVYQREKQVREELDNLYKSLGIKNRIFDNVEIDSNYPEEYGLIQMNAIQPPRFPDSLFKSLGRALHGQNTTLFFDDGFQLNSETFAILYEACRKIQLLSGNNKILLLKNPWDFTNFLHLKKAFPNAKFIFIHRHPIQVINSRLKTLRSVLENKNPYVAIQFKMYAKLFEMRIVLSAFRLVFLSEFFSEARIWILSRNLTRAFSNFLDNINSLESKDFISVKYEELCIEPDITISKILKFLSIEQNLAQNCKTQIQPRGVKLLPEVNRRTNYICRHLKPYMSQFGYEI